ncbi:MBL fold metallo-hydrolase [Roseibaca sp. Y0-43]|uniref:MBL fold metallo-hydrolase n=1 Tax=Roseibaca sp. Y0-43 TaxID=2816854 RepID=UPI001D0CBD4C|nr:MBL fold metallo-hydrolase [Roseibaca sp. Y0-43]MCC1481382.1 MBL fold metallo-hydrolase [Roseibaca sp. Y0-43]
MHRRLFLQSTIAASLAAQGLLPRRARATTTLEAGGARLDMVSDGNLVLPFDTTLESLPAEFLAELRDRYGLTGDQMTPPCNHTLLRDGDRTVLFDVGAGFDFMPSAGMLPDSLAEMGIAPEDVTHLVITHGHPDHIWGLLDDFDEPFLPNAEIIMGRAEWEYWMDPTTIDTIGAERQSFAVGAARRLEMIADQVTLIEDGAEVVPGVLAVASHGHTPGHMSYQVQVGGQGVLVTGDAIGNGHVAFERPTFASASDQDPETGATTRAALLDRITADDLLVAGFHVGDGGLGRAEKLADGAYRFNPEI